MIGIGIRTQIPPSELGPAMGPLPQLQPRGAGIGIGLTRRFVTPRGGPFITPAPAGRGALAHPPRATMPTDAPATSRGFEPIRDVGAAQVGAAEAAQLGTGPRLPFDLGDAARTAREFLGWLGGLARGVGQATRNPALVIGGQLLTRAAPAAPTAPVTAPPADLSGIADVRAEAIAEARATAEAAARYELQASRGTANLETGTGTVQTAAGERPFTFDPFVFTDGAGG